MIEALFSTLNRKLETDRTIASLDGKMTGVSSLPVNRIESYLASFGPYERCLNEMGMFGSEPARFIEDSGARIHQGTPIAYGKTRLGIRPDDGVQPLEAVYIQYVEPGEGVPDKPESIHRSTEVATVLFVEDGTVAWFYTTRRSPLSHAGFTYPAERDLKTDISYPEDPAEGVAEYIRREMLAYIGRMGSEPIAVDFSRGERTTLPEDAARSLSGGDTAVPVIKMGPEQFVDYTLDTDAFRALTQIVALSVDTFKTTTKETIVM